MNNWTVRGLLCLACSAVAPAMASAHTDAAQQQQVGETPAPAPQRQVGDTPAPPVVQPAPQGPQRPQYQDLRPNEDWSHIDEVAGPADFWDPVKFIKLGDRGWYTSLGGEIRERYDNWHQANFGYVPAVWLNSSLQRYMFHADTHFGPKVRAFVQVQSALEYGKTGGPFHTDEDTFEIQQAFVDFRTSNDPNHYTRVRVGRQEIALGADHFISTSDYFNARRNFDGATLTVGRGAWTWFAQATKPVEKQFGAFDDAPEPGRTAWGGGFFAPNPYAKQGRIGVFYAGLDTKDQLWNRGLGRDQRHTLGARIERQAQSGWDYTYEALAQLGTFTPVQDPSVSIRAWALVTDSGFTFAKSKHYPRIGVGSAFTSGDGGHGSLGTFHPLFPDTSYSGKLALVGPSNTYAVTPTFRFGLTRRIYVLTEWSSFWRQNTNDGIYTPALLTVPVDSGIVGYLQKPGNLSKARYIGNQAGIVGIVNINTHLTYVAGLMKFLTIGQFLKETPPAEPTTLFVTFFNYSF